MRILYNIFFTAGFVLAAPYYFLRLRRRGNWKPGFWQRFGRYDSKLKQAITNRHTMWLHAVSVGEVNICTQLIRALETRLPNMKFVVSTTTTTGMGELHKKLPSHISKIYYPVDARFAVKRALLSINPRAVVLVEAEIWPNFLWCARDLRIPMFVVNARLSERSFTGYSRAGFIFRKLFASFAGVGAQNESDAARLVSLGCKPEAVKIVGSLKFDAARVEDRHMTDVPALLSQIGVGDDTLIFLGGSTHDGEEEILARVYKRLRDRFPNLFLILVPRHFERSRLVGDQMRAMGLDFVYRKDISPSSKRNSRPRPDCLIVNTTGELRHFYKHASVIFVGKSMSAHGGQNPIEPGALGKAMVFGPNMENFAEISRSFVESRGAIQAPDEPALEQVVATLLADRERRETLGSNALKVVGRNLGAMGRTVDMIVQHLHDDEVFITPGPGSLRD